MILKIKDKLRGNTESIIHILNELRCEHIKPLKNNEIRWGGNNGSKINIKTLAYVSYSHNHKGDVITMVSLLKNIKLGQAIKWLAEELNLSYEYNKVEIQLPFGAFFKKYNKVIDDDVSIPKTYPIERLDDYELACNKLWVADGISLKTQEYFGIRFDHQRYRIVIPYFNEAGELVGAMGRINEKNIGDKVSKYLGLIPFSKSKVLYGLDKNYNTILENDILYIFEAEKSTILMHEYGMDFSVALGGKEIHKRQKQLIKSMCISRCVLCLDEGLTEEEIKEEAKKIKILNPFFKNKVGYIFDDDNTYLKKDSKKSPIDDGLKIFFKLLDEKVRWLDE